MKTNLCIFLLTGAALNLCAQDTLPACRMRKNWSAGFGTASYTVNEERMTLADMSGRYPELGLSGKDFSSWKADEKVVSVEMIPLPVSFMLGYGFPLGGTNTGWLKNTELNLSVSVGISESYTGNLEKITGNNTAGGIISRELYYLDGWTSVGALHLSASRSFCFGKKRRLYAGLGAGAAAVMASTRYYLYHVRGTYVVTGTSHDPHGWSTYPAEALDHRWSLAGETYERLPGVGYEVPLSFGFIAGKRRRLHLGEQFYFGQYFLFSERTPAIIYNAMTGVASVRLDIK